MRRLNPSRLVIGIAFSALVGASACSPILTEKDQPSAPSASSETASPAGSSLPTPTPPTIPTAKPSTTPTVPATSRQPTKNAAAVLARGAGGERVRELQHRLRQLEWYSGTITGHYGHATVNAVHGFQTKRKLTATGDVDQTTWNRLVGMTRKPTHDEMHNLLRPGPALLKRGSRGDTVRSLQARLKQIGWFSPRITGAYGSTTVATVKGFLRKRAIPVTGEVDSRTWHRLTAMTRAPSANEKHNIAAKPSAVGLNSRCLTGRALCISKRTDQLAWVVDGKARLRVDVRFGSQELPTRNGTFRVGWKSRHHVSSLYHTSMPYAMFFSGGQAVHYSRDFAARGYRGASHGCVNVRDLAAIRKLFNTVRVGDKVIVYA
jgi:peptidoglycan hydrolase-like protein with peptidoglycan-binding domain